MTAVSILDVWRALGGGELRRGRGRAFWRDGNGFNISIDTARGLWCDRARGNAGGGALALVETALACDRRDALAWLAAHGFIEQHHANRPPMTPEEKRTWAVRRRRAALLADEAELWRAALVDRLEVEKAAAYQAGRLQELFTFAPELERLRRMRGAALAQAFLAARTERPEETSALIAEQRHDERCARDILGWAIGMIGDRHDAIHNQAA